MMTKKEMSQMMSKKQMKMDKETKEHHSGKGTKARVNTIAEKQMFKSYISK